jgi:hypothetical protein
MQIAGLFQDHHRLALEPSLHTWVFLHIVHEVFSLLRVETSLLQPKIAEYRQYPLHPSPIKPQTPTLLMAPQTLQSTNPRPTLQALHPPPIPAYLAELPPSLPEPRGPEPRRRGPCLVV